MGSMGAAAGAPIAPCIQRRAEVASVCLPASNKEVLLIGDGMRVSYVASQRHSMASMTSMTDEVCGC